MHLPRRFDDALMRAPDACGPADPALIATLRAWCEGGTAPTLAEPLRAATIAPSVGLTAAACVLDGNLELAHLGRWRGLRWRLQILWREQSAGDDAQPANPWDCGWSRDGPLGQNTVLLGENHLQSLRGNSTTGGAWLEPRRCWALALG